MTLLIVSLLFIKIFNDLISFIDGMTSLLLVRPSNSHIVVKGWVYNDFVWGIVSRFCKDRNIEVYRKNKNNGKSRTINSFRNNIYTHTMFMDSDICVDSSTFKDIDYEKIKGVFVFDQIGDCRHYKHIYKFDREYNIIKNIHGIAGGSIIVNNSVLKKISFCNVSVYCCEDYIFFRDCIDMGICIVFSIKNRVIHPHTTHSKYDSWKNKMSIKSIESIDR